MKKLPILLILLAAAAAILATLGFSYGLALAKLPAIAAAALVVTAIAAQLVSKRAPVFYRYAARITAVFACAAIAMCGVASGQIISRYFDDEVPDDTAVIVLGCGLSQKDQTSPSLMLYGRLQAAESYLRENPEAKVILSGGQGPGEKISEAESMYRYFEARGFDMTNIFREDQSKSTEENIAFSVELAKREGISLENGIAIVTDGFHQYRAHSHAHTLGLETYSVSARAPVALQAFYWAREIPGIIVQSWI